jgi:AraC family transcriptional regulator
MSPAWSTGRDAPATHKKNGPQTRYAPLAEWLPAAGFISVDAPDLGRYAAAFDPATGYDGVDIRAPVE